MALERAGTPKFRRTECVCLWTSFQKLSPEGAAMDVSHCLSVRAAAAAAMAVASSVPSPVCGRARPQDSHAHTCSQEGGPQGVAGV